MIAAVEKAPPAPPTLGPTYLSEVTSVRVEQRGPVQLRRQVLARSRAREGWVEDQADERLSAGAPQGDTQKASEPVEFVEEARFTKDDFGNWRVSYDYDSQIARWRLGDRAASRGDQIGTEPKSLRMPRKRRAFSFFGS